MKNVGYEICKIIKKKKLKQKDVADMLHMTAVNISKILKKDSIDAALLERIARVLNVPISTFFDDDLCTSPEVEKQFHPVEDQYRPVEDGLSPYETKKGIKCPNCDKLERLIDSQHRLIEQLERELERQK